MHCAGTGLVQLCGKWGLGADVPQKAAFVQRSFLMDHCCSTSEGVSPGANEGGRICLSAAAVRVVHSRDCGNHGVRAYENTVCETHRNNKGRPERCVSKSMPIPFCVWTRFSVASVSLFF